MLSPRPSLLCKCSFQPTSVDHFRTATVQSPPPHKTSPLLSKTSQYLSMSISSPPISIDKRISMLFFSITSLFRAAPLSLYISPSFTRLLFMVARSLIFLSFSSNIPSNLLSTLATRSMSSRRRLSMSTSPSLLHQSRSTPMSAVTLSRAIVSSSLIPSVVTKVMKYCP